MAELGNSASWKTRIEDTLDQAGDEILDCITTTPAFNSGTDAEKKAKRKLDRKALTIIRLRVDNTVMIRIQALETAKATWDTLKQLYEPVGYVYAIDLFGKIISEKYVPGTPFEQHVNKMVGYLNGIRIAGQTIQDMFWLMAFLRSLDDSWAPIVQTIEFKIPDGMEELVYVNSIIKKLQGEAVRRTSTDTKNSETFFSRDKKKKGKCRYCDKEGQQAPTTSPSPHQAQTWRKTSNSQLQAPGSRTLEPKHTSPTIGTYLLLIKTRPANTSTEWAKHKS
jgi:hypothetical protein